MRIANRLILVAVVVLPWQSTQAADHGFYVSGAAGGASNHNVAGACYGSYKIGQLVLSGRTLRTTEVGLFGTLGSSYPLESASDVAFLVGIASKYNGSVSATIELGPAYAKIVRRFDHFYHVSDSWGNEWRTDRQVKNTLGLALQCQMYLHRVGVVLMGDSNPSRGFFAVLLAFRIGKCT